MIANLDGEPMLAHSLGAVREFDPVVTVVVLGHGADEVERSIEWSTEIRVRNNDPGRGLASSLRTGLHALEMLPSDYDGAFIVLGDQPRLRANVMEALADAASRARPADRPLLVPRYEADPGPRNPVLLMRPAWPQVELLRGDRGLAEFIEDWPHLVLTVPVTGAMPDVDRLSDLERL